MSSSNYHAPRPQRPPTDSTQFYPLNPPQQYPPPVPQQSQYGTPQYQAPYASNQYQNKQNVSYDYRDVTRTPSPTPSEAALLAGETQHQWGLAGVIKSMRSPEYWKKPRNIVAVVLMALIVGLVIAYLVLQTKIFDALEPASHWLKTTPGAWLIPIGIMIILSFPPLFGHELVAIFCGIVWGLGIGFAIVAAGTIIGEVCTYFVFRFGCKSRGKKAEQTNLRYALTSEVIRRGGLKIAIIARYSAIPGHLTTAIFATAGLNFWHFLVAAILALPKQLVVVLLGINEHPTDGSETVSKKTKIIKIVVITAMIIVTLFAMRYINAQMEAVKYEVIHARRKARQAKGADSPSSSRVPA